jgi:chromate transporter
MAETASIVLMTRPMAERAPILPVTRPKPGRANDEPPPDEHPEEVPRMIFLILFAEFFKIGLFAIGGGLATLPFLYKLAEKYDWITAELIPDMVAVAQSTPGAIGVNIAVYSGFTCAGIGGGAIAALGLVTPSIIIIVIIARMFQAFKESAVVRSVFSGLRPAAAGLLSAACFAAIKRSLYNSAAVIWYESFRWRECILFVVLFLLIYRFKRHPIIYIAAAGVVGILLGL